MNRGIFYIAADNSGNVIFTNIDKIAAVDEAAAMEYAGEILSGGRESGFIDGYRYIVEENEKRGYTYIIFLDCSRSLSTAKTFLLASITTSLIGLGAVMILLILISRRIVKPFLENYEKQKRFITDAGHELKTPLAIINADAEVLEMDIGENEWLKDIHSQTKHMAELTNNLIVLSRAEESGILTDITEFSLTDMTREAAGSYGTVAKAQNKSLKSDIDENVVIHGDEKAVRRLISILLDNAVKYSEEEGEISLSLKGGRRSVRLSVYNTTASIKKESLGSLFDRFYRTDSSRNSRTGGYGLGLSIAASTVKAHKGKISASTEDEKSLLITVTLPV